MEDCGPATRLRRALSACSTSAEHAGEQVVGVRRSRQQIEHQPYLIARAQIAQHRAPLFIQHRRHLRGLAIGRVGGDLADQPVVDVAGEEQHRGANVFVQSRRVGKGGQRTALGAIGCGMIAAISLARRPSTL